MLKEVSEAEARRLILNGTAGYWSIHRRSVPIPNTAQTVVRLRGKLFLVPASDLEVTYVGYLGEMNGRQKGAFGIKCSNDEIIALAKEEAKERGVIIGPEGMKETPE